MWVSIASDKFRPYKNEEEVMGYFSYEAAFLYVDRDMTGGGVSVKKGWNKMYGRTTTPPSGFTDKWSFEPY